MSEKKRLRKQYTYRYRTNAIDVTVYSLTGETIPVEVRKQIEEAVTEIALQNKLVVNIALT